MATGSYAYGLGRRKSATARVRLLKGKGNFAVNGTPLQDYIAGSKYLLHELNQPFMVLDLKPEAYDITALVRGGGHNGQIEAIRLGIAKALAGINDDYKSTLRRADLLGRDSREKERKKFGLKGARKQRQFTKR